MSPASATTQEFWSWNNTTLNMPHLNITSFGGSRMDLPLNRGSNYTVAYRDGQLWRPKNFDQRTILNKPGYVDGWY